MRSTAFFVNGGAGRVICSIPAFEKYKEEHPEDDFIIVAEGGTDFFKGHPDLYPRVYDNWHKDLFRTHIQMRNVVTTEPYRIWEYYNQKCNLSQAFDIQINNKGVRELPKPNIKLSRQEMIQAKFVLEEVRQATKKTKVVVFQPFGRGAQMMGNFITDSGGRSFELSNVLSIVKKLQKKGYAVIFMGEFNIDFQKEGCKEPVATPAGIDLRQWAAIIAEADLLLGCDSVGQHIAYSQDVPAVVVVGSTCKENISYPDCDKFEVLDMGEGLRIYDPIRICADEVTFRNNDGIMAMNNEIENVILESVDKMIKKYYVKKEEIIVLPTQGCGPQGCEPQQQTSPQFKGASEVSQAMSPVLDIPKKTSAVEELIKSTTNLKNNGKKPSGFLDTVKN
jgi:ADP-heptose:LPS heptosyltransferase